MSESEQMDKIEIYTEKIPLDQLLKWAGIAETGGQARCLIDNGEVTVDGIVMLERRKKIFPGSTVVCGGATFVVVKSNSK